MAYILAFASSILTCITYGFGYLWCGFCLCTSYYGYPLYLINNKEKVISLINKVEWSAMKDENNKSMWWFIGKGFIGTIYSSNKDRIVYIMCSNNTFTNLTEITDLPTKSTENPIKIPIYTKTGNFYWPEYNKRDFNVTNFIANKKQLIIVEKIAESYKSTKKLVVLISGGQGSGKSMCSILLTKYLKGTLVRTFEPTDPGDNIASLYATIDPSEDKPLIIVLDEVNILYHNIFHNLIPFHKNISIQIKDKTSLNRFFDDINLGLYPHIIVLMTSNMSPEEIESKYDASYIREGRVDLQFNLEKDEELTSESEKELTNETDEELTNESEKELTSETYQELTNETDENLTNESDIHSKISNIKRFLKFPKILKIFKKKN